MGIFYGSLLSRQLKSTKWLNVKSNDAFRHLEYCFFFYCPSSTIAFNQFHSFLVITSIFVILSYSWLGWNYWCCEMDIGVLKKHKWTETWLQISGHREDICNRTDDEDLRKEFELGKYCHIRKKILKINIWELYYQVFFLELEQRKRKWLGRFLHPTTPFMENWKRVKLWIKLTLDK